MMLSKKLIGLLAIGILALGIGVGFAENSTTDSNGQSYYCGYGAPGAPGASGASAGRGGCMGWNR